MLKRLLTVIGAVLLTVLFAWTTHAQSAAVETPKAPEITFSLKGVNGKTYDLAQLRGKVVLVSFGATWCVPCAWELTAIEELKEEFKNKPVEFLWVSIETEKEASNALLKHYAKTRGVTIPVLRDADRTTFAQFSDRVRIPVVVFFDQQGQFVAPAHRGMSSEPIQYKNIMRERLGKILNEAGDEDGADGAGEK